MQNLTSVRDVCTLPKPQEKTSSMNMLIATCTLQSTVKHNCSHLAIFLKDPDYPLKPQFQMVLSPQYQIVSDLQVSETLWCMPLKTWRKLAIIPVCAKPQSLHTTSDKKWRVWEQKAQWYLGHWICWFRVHGIRSTWFHSWHLVSSVLLEWKFLVGSMIPGRCTCLDTRKQDREQDAIDGMHLKPRCMWEPLVLGLMPSIHLTSVFGEGALYIDIRVLPRLPRLISKRK